MPYTAYTHEMEFLLAGAAKIPYIGLSAALDVCFEVELLPGTLHVLLQ